MIQYRIRLVFPTPGEYIYGDQWKLFENPAPPLGPLYVATPLMKAGYNVSFIDLGVDHMSREEFVEMLHTTDILMISCFTNAMHNIEKIIKAYKEYNSQGRIVCGGPHCNETGIHVNGSDVTVYGEAEHMIVDLTEKLVNGRDLGAISGISFHSNGTIIRNAGYNLVKDLDTIDLPAIELTLQKNYNFLYGIRIEHVLPLITTRGCPFKCKFCTFQSVPYRERSVKNVMMELRRFKELNAKYVVIPDDNFLYKRQRIDEIASSILQQDLDFKIIIQGRVDLVDPEIYKKLRRAGLILLLFGTESANQDILNYYKKGTTLDKIEKVIRLANRLNIITFSGIIIGAPIETKEHIDNNKKFFHRVPLDFISVNILRFSYPSPLWKEAYNAGKIKLEEIIVAANDQLCNFSYDELLQFQKEILISFYKNWRRILRISYKIIINFDLKTFIFFLSSLAKKNFDRTPESFHGVSIKRIKITS